MDLQQVIDGVGEGRGRLQAGIYSDPELFALERERLFTRTWQFLAHESELPRPWRLRRPPDPGRTPSSVARDESRARCTCCFNMCRHRGMQVCRSEARAAPSTFRCPYHAWTYRNDGRLVGVPFHAQAYGGDAGLDKAARGW